MNDARIQWALDELRAARRYSFMSTEEIRNAVGFDFDEELIEAGKRGLLTPVDNDRPNPTKWEAWGGDRGGFGRGYCGLILQD